MRAKRFLIAVPRTCWPISLSGLFFVAARQVVQGLVEELTDTRIEFLKTMQVQWEHVIAVHARNAVSTSPLSLV